MITWSIGLIPVQEWIAEARRSRDLKIGSSVLSWFMSIALNELLQQGADILVPAVSREDLANAAALAPSGLLRTDYGIPNRASGWWSDASLDFAAREIAELQRKIDEKWEGLRQEVGRHVRPEMLEQQLTMVRNPIQLVWCARARSVTVSPEKMSHETTAALEEIGALYLSVKRTRPVAAHAGQPIGKCGQCGKREASGPSDWDAWRAFQRRLDGTTEVRRGHRLDVGERLCPVCIVKRFAGYLSSGSFPSTSEIAAHEWLLRVTTFSDIRGLVDEWRRRADGLDKEDPYPFLYSRTIERLEKTAEDDEAVRNQARSVREALSTLTEAIEAKHLDAPSAPSNYLAVVTFDGDNMGEAVQRNPATIPPALLAFSRTLAKTLTTDFGATAFYLGGDEGLILCPIERLLNLTDHIHTSFLESMSKIELLGEGMHRPTISVGVAIFDRERPLAAAMKSARRALKIAKELDGKSALGVSVSTASGNNWSAVEHWGEGWERVRTAVELTRDGRLSSGWAYDVESLVEGLSPTFFARGRIATDALREEIRRITHRRIRPSDEAARAEDRGAAEAGEKEAVWEKLRGPQWWTETPDSGEIGYNSGQLHLIAFLAREMHAVESEERRPSAREEVAE